MDGGGLAWKGGEWTVGTAIIVGVEAPAGPGEESGPDEMSRPDEESNGDDEGRKLAVKDDGIAQPNGS